jgi:hypothetical protein
MTKRPMGADLSHAERRTDWQADRHDEVDSRSSQFCKRTYKGLRPEEIFRAYIIDVNYCFYSSYS